MRKEPKIRWELLGREDLAGVSQEGGGGCERNRRGRSWGSGLHCCALAVQSSVVLLFSWMYAVMCRLGPTGCNSSMS